MSNSSLIIKSYTKVKDDFAGVFEKSTFTTINLLISLILSIILVVLFLGIIGFDKIRSDSKRLIMNRIFCSGCWLCIGYLFLVHLPDLLRYTYGPLPEVVCFYHLVFKNAFSLQLLIILNLIVIFQYIFIFWLKNPAAFQDEFWHFFLVIWMSGFSFVSQWTFAFFPGTQSLNYYVCLGMYPPESSVSFSPKQNHLMRLFQICTVTLHFFMYIRIEKFRRKGSTSVNCSSWSKNHILYNLDNKFFASVFMYFLHAFNVIVSIILNVKINSVDPKTTNFYPNYLYFNFYHLLAPVALSLPFVVVYYIKHHEMFKILKTELKELLG
jgi:hypothetical protein